MFQIKGNRPQPPIDMVANPTLDRVFTIAVAIIFVGFVVFAIRYFIKNKSPIGIFCMLGGVLCSLLEPYCDFIGLLWFPNINTWLPAIYSNCFGVYVPLWVALGYACYVGGCPFIVYTILKKNGPANRKTLAKLMLIFIVSDVILEVSGLNIGIYTYYGFQPFQFFKMPVWWSITGGLLCVGGGVLLYKLEDRLSGCRSIAAILIIPANFMMFIGWTDWPIMIALDLNISYVVSYVFGAMFLVLSWLAYKGVCLLMETETIGLGSKTIRLNSKRT